MVQDITASSRIVTIPGPAGPLEGELLTTPGATDGVIIIPGSGLTDRNGNSPSGLNSDCYVMLAEELAMQGLNVLRVDKRGMFGSAAAVKDANAVTVPDYADDLAAWAGLLRMETGVARIWAAGHSEGGLVALCAAQEAAVLDGLVLLAVPGRRIKDVLLSQFEANGVERDMLAEAKQHLVDLEHGRHIDDGDIHPALEPLFQEQIQDFMHSLLSLDPAALLKAADIPGLIIHGGRDIQVAEKDARLLAAAGSHVTLHRFDEMTHLLKADVPGDPMATYMQPGLPLMPGLVTAITTFIAAQTSR